jgi:hypothetical protein
LQGPPAPTIPTATAATRPDSPRQTHAWPSLRHLPLLTPPQDSYAERNELRDDTATLEELGITGAPEDADQPMEVAIFYEFKPCDHDDPLLLVWKS